MSDPSSPKEDLGLERPSAARIYDWLLGGSHNFAADRAAGTFLAQVTPEIIPAARANRAYLRRAVRAAHAEGIDQFLDLGSGIPTAGNVHDIAQRLNPDARVVYVDTDPVAVEHARALLRSNQRADVLLADLRNPQVVTGDPVTTRLIDFSQPVAVLLVSVLHFVPEDAGDIIAGYRQVMAPGSLLVLSHGTTPTQPEDAERATEVAQVYAVSPTPIRLRSHAEVRALFDGFDLMEPGLVTVDRWRPECSDQPDPACRGILAGVGRRPGAPRRLPPGAGNSAPQYASPAAGRSTSRQTTGGRR